MQNILVKKLGLVDYKDSWAQMQDFTKQRTSKTTDEIWFLEHSPVFTLGYQGDQSHILQKGEIPIVNSDRGGNVTYHGPGQLIGYLLIDLKRKKLSVHDLVRLTEQTIITTLLKYGVQSHTIKNAPGIYVNNSKICSLGFRVKKGCSYHGFALNLNMDLIPFKYINPCGLENMQVTQLGNYTQNLNIDDIQNAIKLNLLVYFSYTEISSNM